YNALVDVLTQQRDELIATTVPVNMVTAPQPGFYISSIDGLETTFTQDFVKGLTSQDILTAEENFTQTVQTQTSGKIISDYKWYFVCTVPKTQAARFVDAPTETKVTIKFQDSTAGSVPAFIESVTDEETSEYVKVVLRCEVMRPDIANLRFETADISFRTIKGIRIAKSATNIVDGELGVYIKYGHLVSFKKITPIFENSEYILVPLNPNKEITGINEVKLFDEVIVEGKDLYDGKLL
ncbi:MAG: HlyD family efflux transporter periplasmic adaptor subunit, partial [Oscillospiraceae bacterium]